MKKSLSLLLIILMINCLFAPLSIAQTGYVSDMLLLTFRQGPGNSHAVIKTLKSDTPVSILGEENEFYNVELQSREVGWVDKKFIVFETPKSVLIAELKQENKTLENQILTLKTLTQTLQDQILIGGDTSAEKISSLEASLKAALDENEKTRHSLSDNKKKYDTLIEQSRNIQSIVKENKILQEKNEVLSKDLKQYKGENKDLFRTGMIKWFLAGVGVLLLGWILGQSVSSRKRRSGSSLLS